MPEHMNTPLNIPERKIGGYAIVHKIEPPHTRFDTASERCRLFGQKSETLSWPFETTWHKLVSDEHGVWMSDLPCEQAQHAKMLKGVKGSVLVGGLGIGLTPAMLGQSGDVDSIVIVEQSQEVIDLVRGSLPYRDVNIAVVRQDLFAFLTAEAKTQDYGPFDYGLFDIWQSDSENTFFNTVLPLKELGDFSCTEMRCWNEDIMRGQLVGNLHNRFASLCKSWDYEPHTDYVKALAATQPKESSNGTSVRDLLLKNTDDVFRKWSVRFLQDIDSGDLDPELGELLIGGYCQIYGNPDWMLTWEMYKDHARKYAAEDNA